MSIRHFMHLSNQVRGWSDLFLWWLTLHFVRDVSQELACVPLGEDMRSVLLKCVLTRTILVLGHDQRIPFPFHRELSTREDGETGKKAGHVSEPQ